MIETIVSGAALTLIVELAKKLGLPAGYEKVLVFFLAIIAGGLLYWSRDTFEIVANILVIGVTAIGTYEAALKPTKKLLE